MPFSAFSLTGSSVAAWTNVAVNTSMDSNNAYITTGDIEMLLPSTSMVGDVVELTNISDDFTITQGASQEIHFNAVDTTSGAGGSIESTAVNSVIKLVCVVADLEWTVTHSEGNFTIV